MTMVMAKSRRGEAINKAVDNVLNQILGQEAARVLYDGLESNYRIRKNEIALKLDAFNRALEEYFGAGASVIERMIMESLEPEENRSFDFAERRLLKLA